MAYLRTAGPAADPATRLNWGLMAISCAVVLIVTLLLLWGIWRRRPQLQLDAQGRLPVLPARGGMQWIYIGVTLTGVVLLATTVWTVLTLAAVAAPPRKPAVEIEVVAHQWWWELRYKGESPSQTLLSANEIHIPAGEPVLLKLASDDVIHSFWIPRLAGKTDIIPGQVNHAWLQADAPGRYRGQCGEYCGAQHAHMALYVVAQDKADFDRWRQQQMQGARLDQGQAVRGMAVFMARCAICHTVRGTGSFGRTGPDLTHLMSRATIAGGILPNNTGALHGWVADAQAVKPGAHMPAMHLSPQELHEVVAWLQTLE